MNNNEIAINLLRLARELCSDKREAAAGPYTILKNMLDQIKRDDFVAFAGEFGHAMGYAPGADYIIGNMGLKISYILLGFASGRKSIEAVAKIVNERNLKIALKENAAFRGLSYEKSQDVWREQLAKKLRR